MTQKTLNLARIALLASVPLALFGNATASALSLISLLVAFVLYATGMALKVKIGRIELILSTLVLVLAVYFLMTVKVAHIVLGHASH